MAILDIITKEDLKAFKRELLSELGEFIERHTAAPLDKKWLKSAEVRKLLGISSGTLQNMRINGTLPYTQIGGIIYYKAGDINSILEKNFR